MPLIYEDEELQLLQVAAVAIAVEKALAPEEFMFREACRTANR